jgi:ferritin-like metal-binding protein YciE
MAKEINTRDAKLVQYLNEAYGKERELEEALRLHIGMTDRDAYKKRLQDHLKETTAQAKGLERRIKALGGKAERVDLPGPAVASEAAAAVTAVASKAVSLATGPLHVLRGTGQADKLVHNAKTELANEFEEIANYLAIEELAKTVGDKETAKLAKEFRKQEERMAAFLQKLIPQLTKQVAREEIPAAERRTNGSTRRRSTSRSSSNGSSTSRSSSNGSSTKPAARRASSSSRAKSSSSRTTRAKSSASSGSSGTKTARAKGTSSRSTAAKRSTTPKRASSRAKSNGSTRSGSASRSGASASRSSSRAKAGSRS